jgi:hypothetical protein
MELLVMVVFVRCVERRLRGKWPARPHSGARLRDATSRGTVAYRDRIYNRYRHKSLVKSLANKGAQNFRMHIRIFYSTTWLY